jgi:16S rRNA (guanine527-N7)-methyltransferase
MAAPTPVGSDQAEAKHRSQLAQAAVALGLPLHSADIDQLLAYLQLLQRWNSVYNLTALRDPDQMLSHHLVDCLAVVPPLRHWLATGGMAAALAAGAASGTGAALRLRVLDVGSGAGLPGVVLAALQPNWQVSCVDTAGKKASFIKQVAAELRLGQLHGLHARVENLMPPAPGAPGGSAGYDLITSRAFASLADFTRLSVHLLAPHGVWMAMKGKPTDEELTQLPPGIEVFHVEQLQVPGLNAQRCLVWLRRCSA